MLAEDVLELLRPLDEATVGARGFSGISRPLDENASLVKLVVGGALPERGHGIDQLPVLALRRLLQRRSLLEGRRTLEVAKQRPVPRRIEGHDELAPCELPLAVQQLEDGPERCAVERLQLLHEVLDQDVSVAHLAEERREPLELSPEMLCSFGLRERTPRRTEQRTDPARRDAELVQLLRLGADSNAPFPRRHLSQLLAQNSLELVVGEIRRLQSGEWLERKGAFTVHDLMVVVPSLRSRFGIFGIAATAISLALVLALFGVGEEEGALTNWQALVLGLVQGATELLPISSSGHLILVPWAADWRYLQEDDAFNQTFDVALHVGTLAAVVGYFWRDVVRLFAAWLRSIAHRSMATTDERLAWVLVVATIPAAVAGAIGEDFITDRLGEPWQIAILLGVFGVVLLVADQRPSTRELDTVGLKAGVAIGLAQSLALAPGVSRSGITISAGRFLGLGRDAAARLSFLLLIPTTFGAVLWKGITDVLFGDLPAGWQGPFLVGTLASLASGLLAIVFLLGFVRRHTYAPFVVYRLVVGVIVLGLIAAGVRDAAF